MPLNIQSEIFYALIKSHTNIQDGQFAWQAVNIKRCSPGKLSEVPMNWVFWFRRGGRCLPTIVPLMLVAKLS